MRVMFTISLIFCCLLTNAEETSLAALEVGSSFESSKIDTIVILNEKDLQKLCKENNIKLPKVDFTKELVFVDRYCCSRHMRRLKLTAKFSATNKEIIIPGYKSNRMGCEKPRSYPLKLYAIEKSGASSIKIKSKYPHKVISLK